MVGLLITGHGNFGSGIYSALEVIAGQCENVRFADFEKDRSVANYQQELNSILDEMIEMGQEVLVLADLLGGTPFKSAVRYGMKRGHIQVVSGANLSMTLEVEMARKSMTDLEQLASYTIEMGRQSITRFPFKQKEAH